jgi:diguanylate cyclase (GGDEF)-like protein/PAS domain S-box-containing protein
MVVLLAGLTLAAFSQTRIPLLFVLYPLLVLVLLRMGMEWAAISMLFVALTGSWYTRHGEGPFALSGPLTPLDPSILLQIYIASGVFLLSSVTVVLESRRAMGRRIEEIAALHKLVTENSRDIIILSDFYGHRSYVSTAAQSIAGWTPEEIVAQESLELVHPDDVSKAEEALQALRNGVDRIKVELRVRKRDDGYLWVECTLRVVCDPRTCKPSRILNTIQDISERKQSEQQLQAAYRAVEEQALTDVLTGMANRRRFDDYIATEWRRSMRDRQPLSLLMLDVDKFKVYNDTYGHQRGDSCLKQIAEACMDVVARPGDLVARYGGEEFVVILPNTDSAGAMHVANSICEAMRNRRLPHTGNLPGIVTISVGCATLVPGFGKHFADLIEMSDQALYKAKHNGRDQVHNANQVESGVVPETPTLALSDTASFRAV